MKNTVAEINNYLDSLNIDRAVVGIDGYSGIGKTTISDEIEKINKNVKVLHLDEYIVTANTREKLESHLKENRDYLEIEWKNVGDKSLDSLKIDIENFRKENSDKNILIIEGIFFFHLMFKGFFDKVIFLDGDEKSADKRRINREKERWGDKYFSEDHPDSFARLFKLAWQKYKVLYTPKYKADFVVTL
jgi:uridine kinase